MCSVSCWIKWTAGTCAWTRLDLGRPRLSRSSIGLLDDHGRRRTQWWSHFSCFRGFPVASSTSTVTVQGSMNGRAQPAQFHGCWSFLSSSIRKLQSLVDFLWRFVRIWKVFQSHGLATCHWWAFSIVLAPCQHISTHRASNLEGSIPKTGFELRWVISETTLFTRGEDEWGFSRIEALLVEIRPGGSKILLKTKVKRLGLAWLQNN